MTSQKYFKLNTFTHSPQWASEKDRGFCLLLGYVI